MARRTNRSRPKKRNTSGRKKAKKKPSWRKRLLLFGLPLALLVSTVYVFYLDYTVRSQFEGRRWELPARVYARPLELYPGKQLQSKDFTRELTLLHYRISRNADEPGTYVRQGDGYLLHTRAFAFWDGSEVSRRVRIQFNGDTVGSITDIQKGDAVALVRLDPALIASIYPAHNEDRILVKLDDVPASLVKGLISVEDRQFYEHHGIDPWAIGRAMWANVRAGKTVQGGSTLTQQLVKNFFLSNERTLWRKANEAIMALLLEGHYDKQEILQAYLNEVYLGQDGRRSIHGFGLASQFYFQRPLEQLGLHQVALLVGLVKGPSYYDPRRHPDRARYRRNLVLDAMAAQGIVSDAEARQAKQKTLGVTASAPSGVTLYPAFVDLVRRQLRRDYREEDLTSEGLQIFTTLDPTVQDRAEKALVSQVRRLENDYRLPAGQLQGAVVITDAGSGEVEAVVGGREPRFAGFNRALDGVRQVGSLIKPAVYLTALSQSSRYGLATLLDDTELQIRNDDGTIWAPQNYDKLYHGQVPMYLALAHSYNVSTARLGLAVGADAVVDTLQRMGISRPVPNYPSMFLGAVSLSPLEVAQMYQTLAGGGFRTPLRSIRAVLTAEGKPLTRYGLSVTQAFDPDSVFLLNSALEKVVEEGTGRPLRQMLSPTLVVAGKTGTTDDLRDSWFAGFTDDYLAVVWLGMDNNQPTRLTGSTGALWVWGTVMKSIGPHSLQLTAPADIEYAWIDPASGQLADRGCEGAVQLPFLKGTAPTENAPCKGNVTNWIKRIFQ